jgi:hypothetical protein
MTSRTPMSVALPVGIWMTSSLVCTRSDMYSVGEPLMFFVVRSVIVTAPWCG